MHLLLIPLLLVACGDDEDKGGQGDVDDTGEPADDTGEPTDDTNEPPPCEATVLSTDPLDGAVDVALDVSPTVLISEADATASLESDIPGTYTVSEDGLTLIWVADGELDMDTTYTVTATTCTGSQSFSFTTLAVETPEHLLGRTWSFNLSDGTITDPAILEILLGDQLAPGLLGMPAVGPGTVDLRLASFDTRATEPQQDYCLATADVEGASYDEGAVHATEPELWISLIDGDPVPVYNLDFAAVWSEDGASYSGGTLNGELDARHVAVWLDMDGDELCELADGFGFPCSTCPDGEEYCVRMTVEDIAGDEVPTTLIEVTGSDCPGCEDGEPVCE